MSVLINCTNIATRIKNLKDYASKPTPIANYNIIKILEKNKKTTSNKLDDYLQRYSSNFSQPFLPLPPSKIEQEQNLQLSLLSYTSSPSTPLLSYKGINLGSAINMKLAVKLGSLLGKQQG